MMDDSSFIIKIRDCVIYLNDLFVHDVLSISDIDIVMIFMEVSCYCWCFFGIKALCDFLELNLLSYVFYYLNDVWI